MGGRLVTADGRDLPFHGTSLTADARGGLVRMTLQQTFVNHGDEPLKVTYQLPLPPDAAVSGYGFTIGDRVVVGEIDKRAAARERFEDALMEGRTAAILEEDCSTYFRQEIGNVPPHTQVVARLKLDQTLCWIEDCQWEWRFPTAIAPRYMGDESRTASARPWTSPKADSWRRRRSTCGSATRFPRDNRRVRPMRFGSIVRLRWSR